MLSIKLVYLDYYLSVSETAIFSLNTELNESMLKPIIRVFGYDREGRSHCLHVHNVSFHSLSGWDNISLVFSLSFDTIASF